jgi:D-lactate dehydrogenase (cytochrome)
MFGHIGNNHIHVNILPVTHGRLRAGQGALQPLGGSVSCRMGGTVSAEHGIGKLKTGMLEIMYGADGVAEMRRVKRLFDPDCRLNPGNLFSC